MSQIWCELRCQVSGGRLCYRGVVRVGSLATWRGEWRENKHHAIRDAERAAYDLYNANSHQVKVAATAGPWPAINKPGDYRRPGTGLA